MTFAILVFFAQTTAAPPVRSDQLGGVNVVICMAFAFAVLYFISIRPQSKRQKELQAQIAALKTGDKVVTNGGIHGLVVNIQDGPTLILKIADNVKIEVEKTAVTTVLRSAEAKVAA